MKAGGILGTEGAWGLGGWAVCRAGALRGTSPRWVGLCMAPGEP